MNRRGSLVLGVRDALPVVVGVIPFGLVAGAAAVAVGLSPLEALGLSVVVFAGASQLAAIELIGQGASGLVVVATVLVINLRMTMYSASIAPYFEELGLRDRVPLAYLLTDQAFALSVMRYDGEEDPVARPWYYVGVGATLWLVWQVCTVAGALGGATLPEAIPLEFAVPLVFLALLVPAIDGRATGAAAVVGGGLALGLSGAPFNLGLMAGALGGVLAGVAVEGRGGDA